MQNSPKSQAINKQVKVRNKAEPAEFLKISEVAAHLRCSPKFVHQLIAQKRLEAWRMTSKRFRVSRKALAAFIATASETEKVGTPDNVHVQAVHVPDETSTVIA